MLLSGVKGHFFALISFEGAFGCVAAWASLTALPAWAHPRFLPQLGVTEKCLKKQLHGEAW